MATRARKGASLSKPRKRSAGSSGARRTRAARPRRRVYFFGAGRATGRASMGNLLGGKGANLAEMTRLGIPVPAGFTLSTGVCAEFNRARGRLSPERKRAVLAHGLV